MRIGADSTILGKQWRKAAALMAAGTTALTAHAADAPKSGGVTNQVSKARTESWVPAAQTLADARNARLQAEQAQKEAELKERTRIAVGKIREKFPNEPDTKIIEKYPEDKRETLRAALELIPRQQK